MPTQEQLDQVKKNIDNLMDLSNHVHEYSQDALQEVYLKLSQNPDPDPGQKFLTTFFTAVFTSIGSIDFPGAGTFGAFLGTFFGAYAGPDTPPSLDKSFGSLWGRMSMTFLQAADDLSRISADPGANWDKVYTNPLTLKSEPVSSLGDAKNNMPNKYDPLYQHITDTIISQFRYEITCSNLSKKFYIELISHSPADPFLIGYTDADFTKFASNIISKQKCSYFAFRDSYEIDCCTKKKFSGIQYSQFGLSASTGWAPDDLCDWLFQDDQFGTITNPQGVAKRVDIFTQWGIQGTDLIQNWPGSVWQEQAADVSAQDQIHAEAWGKLFEGTGRQELEKRLIRKFYADPIFAEALTKEPEKTIAAELGVELPSFAKVEILREERGDYKLVIPAAGLASYLPSK